MKFVTYILVCLLPDYTASAQVYPLKAVVALLNGDTLHGHLYYTRWRDTPQEIRFNTDSLPPLVCTHSKATLGSFIIGDGEMFETRPFVRASHYRDPDNPHTLYGSCYPDTAIFRVLVKGNVVDLYELKENGGCAFFMKRKGNDNLEELIRDGLDTFLEGLPEERYHFRKQLRELVDPGNRTLLKKINHTSFSHIPAVIKEINGINTFINKPPGRRMLRRQKL